MKVLNTTQRYSAKIGLPFYKTYLEFMHIFYKKRGHLVELYCEVVFVLQPAHLFYWLNNDWKDFSEKANEKKWVGRLFTLTYHNTILTTTLWCYWVSEAIISFIFFIPRVLYKKRKEKERSWIFVLWITVGLDGITDWWGIVIYRIRYDINATE